VQTNFADGSYRRVFETEYDDDTDKYLTKTRDYQPPLTILNSTYENQTALLYVEYGDTVPATLATEEIRHFNDGWFAIFVKSTNEMKSGATWLRYTPSSSTPVAGVRPTYEKVVNSVLDDGTFVEFFAENDTTIYYPPQPDSAVDSEYRINISEAYSIMYRNGSIKAFFNNGTIAWLNRDRKFVSYIVRPKSFAIDYPKVFYADGSYWIDFTARNGTKRFVQSEPLEYSTATRPRNTSFEIATALRFSETWANGTTRAVYRNGTIAIF